jgi:hypothetical protein
MRVASLVTAFFVAMFCSLGLGACLDHRASPDCKYGIVPGDKEPGDDCTEDEECIAGSVCFEGTCVGDGSLRVSLGWTAQSDFDLHVVVPNGAEIYYGDPAHSGGQLDVDDCVGECDNPDGVHVENVVFAESPMVGSYLVWVENFSGEAAGSFFIEVEGDGVYDYWEGDLPSSGGALSPIYEFLFDAP